MQHTYSPEDAAHQKKTMKALAWVANSLSSEVFKWVGWVAAIAALQVVKVRTEAQWLLLVIVPLYLLLAMRIQWFLKVEQPEEDHADGSMTARFTGGRAVLGLVVAAFAWWFVWGLSNAIAQSDLLPPIEQEIAQFTPAVTTHPTPPNTPSEKPPVTPSETPKVTPIKNPPAIPAPSATSQVPKAVTPPTISDMTKNPKVAHEVSHDASSGK